jgi:hypothetical protein
MPSAVESIMVIFMMATGDPFIVWEGLSYTNHKNIGRVHWFLFVLIVFLLLLNLLIAMMGDTYAKVRMEYTQNNSMFWIRIRRFDPDFGSLETDLHPGRPKLPLKKRKK